MSDFIPNSFQTPNAYVDQFMYVLTSEEYKVLSYIARRIFGFDKRQDRISITQLVKGIRTKDGRVLDYGTGLPEAAARKALNGLVRYRFLIVLAPAIPAQQKPPLFALQLDSFLIDQEGLEQRKAKELEAQRSKTSKARNAFKVQKADTSCCQQHQPPGIVDNTSPPVVDNTSPPVVHNTHNKQYETQRETQSNSLEEEFTISSSSKGNSSFDFSEAQALFDELDREFDDDS